MTMTQAILMMVGLALVVIGAITGLTLIGLGGGDAAGSQKELPGIDAAQAWFEPAEAEFALADV